MTPKQVLILSAHHGELDRRIIAQANTLAQSGRQVTLVSVPATMPSAALHPAVRLCMPPAPPRRRRPLPRLLHVPLRAPLRPLRRWIWARRLEARTHFFLAQTPPGRYDIIHCHDLDTLPAAQSVRAAICPDARLIYDAHELYPYQETDLAFQDFWARIEREHIRRPDLVITVNQSIAEEMTRLYAIERPAIIYNSYGIPRNQTPLPVEAFLAHFGAPAHGFRVLFQGGLSPYRNLPALVRAFGLLDPSCHLFLLGSGPLEAQLHAECRRRRIKNVFFGNHVPQSELLRYTVHADLGVIPYEDAGLLNMRYCTPNKLFEFIESQIPVCASDLPELARFVSGNRIGAVYPMRSSTEIASAVGDCRQRCERGDFATAVLRRTQNDLSWDGQGRKLIGLYELLCA